MFWKISAVNQNKTISRNQSPRAPGLLQLRHLCTLTFTDTLLQCHLLLTIGVMLLLFNKSGIRHLDNNPLIGRVWWLVAWRSQAREVCTTGRISDKSITTIDGTKLVQRIRQTGNIWPIHGNGFRRSFSPLVWSGSRCQIESLHLVPQANGQQQSKADCLELELTIYSKLLDDVYR